MSKYDWSDTPHWINWVFTDQDGDVFGCDNKPCTNDGFHGSPSQDNWDWLYTLDPTEDWRDSLEQRPQEFKE